MATITIIQDGKRYEVTPEQLSRITGKKVRQEGKTYTPYSPGASRAISEARPSPQRSTSEVKADVERLTKERAEETARAQASQEPAKQWWTIEATGTKVLVGQRFFEQEAMRTAETRGIQTPTSEQFIDRSIPVAAGQRVITISGEERVEQRRFARGRTGSVTYVRRETAPEGRAFDVDKIAEAARERGFTVRREDGQVKIWIPYEVEYKFDRPSVQAERFRVESVVARKIVDKVPAETRTLLEARTLLTPRGYELIGGAVLGTGRKQYIAETVRYDLERARAGETVAETRARGIREAFFSPVVEIEMAALGGAGIGKYAGSKILTSTIGKGVLYSASAVGTGVRGYQIYTAPTREAQVGLLVTTGFDIAAGLGAYKIARPKPNYEVTAVKGVKQTQEVVASKYQAQKTKGEGGLIQQQQQKIRPMIDKRVDYAKSELLGGKKVLELRNVISSNKGKVTHVVRREIFEPVLVKYKTVTKPDIKTPHFMQVAEVKIVEGIKWVRPASRVSHLKTRITDVVVPYKTVRPSAAYKAAGGEPVTDVFSAGRIAAQFGGQGHQLEGTTFLQSVPIAYTRISYTPSVPIVPAIATLPVQEFGLESGLKTATMTQPTFDMEYKPLTTTSQKIGFEQTFEPISTTAPRQREVTETTTSLRPALDFIPPISKVELGVKYPAPPPTLFLPGGAPPPRLDGLNLLEEPKKPRGKRRRKFAYQPSVLGIVGFSEPIAKPPKLITGLRIRPLLRRSK